MVNTYNLFYNPVLPLTYSPIVVELVSAYKLDEETPDIDFTKYSLYIEPPRSSRPSVQHFIRDPFRITFPSQGALKLELIPSDVYLPIGRYKVSYFKEGYSKALDKQVWIVRSRPRISSYSFLLNTNPYALPFTFWDVLSVNDSASFSYENNMLNVLNENLLNTIINITFQPALTVDQLIEYNINTLPNS